MPTGQPNLPTQPNAGDIWTGPPWLDYVYGCFMAPPPQETRFQKRLVTHLPMFPRADSPLKPKVLNG